MDLFVRCIQFDPKVQLCQFDQCILYIQYILLGLGIRMDQFVLYIPYIRLDLVLQLGQYVL